MNYAVDGHTSYIGHLLTIHPTLGYEEAEAVANWHARSDSRDHESYTDYMKELIRSEEGRKAIASLTQLIVTSGTLSEDSSTKLATKIYNHGWRCTDA